MWNLAPSGWQKTNKIIGETELAITRNNQSLIHVVSIDLNIPGMGGKYSIEEMNPDIKIITASGYTKNEPYSHELAGLIKAFIYKPFDIQTLLMQVRGSLG